METKEKNYYLDAENKEFVIENYNLAKPFSNFLPGIAGLQGIPMWVFYVNRGQGIISCGTQDKDHSIMEFQPANKAYQLCSTQGFRTFIKIKEGKNWKFYEPFQVNHFNSCYKTAQKMFISSAELRIEETNFSLGLKSTVEYFTVPSAAFAALARKLTIENLDKERKE
ncbi:MAG: cellobiose phosphorylase, partial [Candidatus Omnitrophica bacterium]|nr:cellobiose phosphorylase [Candidatus Omnitrophota bacterium]